MDIAVLFGFALAMGVLMQVVREIVPVHIPTALTHTTAVALAIGLSYGLDYSLFDSARQDWLEWVTTGLVLVGLGEFLRHGLEIVAGRRTA